MNLPHAHRQRPGEDMVTWDPGEAPPYDATELIRALPLGCLLSLLLWALIAIAFLFLAGVSPEAHPGWWG